MHRIACSGTLVTQMTMSRWPRGNVVLVCPSMNREKHTEYIAAEQTVGMSSEAP